MDRSQRAAGIAQILLSGVCFGFLGVFGKAAFARGIDAAELLSLRFFLAGSLILVTLRFFSPRRLAISRRDAAWSVVFGAFGYAVFSFFYFQAIAGLSASLAVLLLYLYPVIVPALDFVFFKERIPKERWYVLPMAMAGLFLLIVGEVYVRNVTAVLYGVGSALFYSIYIVFSRHFLGRTDPLPSSGIMQITAGVALGAATWRSPVRLAAVWSEGWWIIIGIAIVCGVAAMTLFLMGLQKLRSWEASVLSTAEPVTGVVLAFLLLGERLNVQQLGGAALVIGAFISLSIPARGRPHG